MKKTKLLMPILGITAIAPAAISLASCGCKPAEEEAVFTDIRLECIGVGQMNYTLTTEYVKVFAVYKKGNETSEVQLECGGAVGYTIKIDNEDVTSNFATQGYLFTQIKKYKVSVSFNGKTIEHEIDVQAVAIKITNNSDERVQFVDLNQTYEYEQAVSVSYTITDSEYKVDKNSSTITRGTTSTSLKDETGVCFLAEKLIIPSALMTDDIVINLQLVKMDDTIKNGALDQDVKSILAACNDYESESITIDAFISKFSINGTTLTSPKELIGAQITVTLNAQVHYARIIDIDHDEIMKDGAKTGKKAALTFDMVTLLSDSTGTQIKCQYDGTTNRNYINSMLRANVSGEGTGTKTLTKSVKELLQEEDAELWSQIKTVCKKVALGSEHTITEYPETLFPLSYTEMGFTEYEKHDVTPGEGVAYKYWVDHQTTNDRTKQDIVKSSYCSYHLVSGKTQYEKQAYAIINGSLTASPTLKDTYQYGISFAFCI